MFDSIKSSVKFLLVSEFPIRSSDFVRTDAKNLSQAVKSPNRRNPSHPEMNFRVRLAGLNPQTTYYYTVESTGAAGVNDGVSSPIRTFKTKQPGSR